MSATPERLNMQEWTLDDDVTKVMIIDPRQITYNSLNEILESTICNSPNTATQITVIKFTPRDKNESDKLTWHSTPEDLKSIQEAVGEDRKRRINKFTFDLIGADAIRVEHRLFDKRKHNFVDQRLVASEEKRSPVKELLIWGGITVFNHFLTKKKNFLL